MISLIVATVGRTDDLERLFKSVVNQTEHDLELLVIDQNQDDRVCPFVEVAALAGLTVLHLRQPVPNLSKARNLGLRHARGEIVAFPDDDCWYESDSLAAALACFDRNPSTGALVADWVEQSAGLGIEPDGQCLDLQAWRAFRGGHASSITLFFRREVLQRLNGFDERLGVGQWYGAAEEVDLVSRALAADVEIRRCHAVRVHHRFAPVQEQPNETLENWSKMRRRARGTGALYAKHRLTAWVIVRGFMAPVLIPLLKADVGRTLCGIFVSLGRIEGMIRWYFREARE